MSPCSLLSHCFAVSYKSEAFARKRLIEFCNFRTRRNQICPKQPQAATWSARPRRGMRKKKDKQMLCVIGNHLYNLRNMENNHEGVLLSVKLQAQATYQFSEIFSEILKGKHLSFCSLSYLNKKLICCWIVFSIDLENGMVTCNHSQSTLSLI